MKLLGDALLEERLKVCRGCYWHQPRANMCGKCGCFLAIKGRFRWFQCPLRKWPQ